jgi:hypothetical protein
MTYIRQAWKWVSCQLYQDVPEPLAVCQFECRRPDCGCGVRWAECPTRAVGDGRSRSIAAR